MNREMTSLSLASYDAKVADVVAMVVPSRQHSHSGD